ncbi:hypothetical protein [Devosia sp.]|uniref:hypothetical protein n=1 Tax=Devosia sp. TaxID=1871048 RepID=UPI002F175AED
MRTLLLCAVFLLTSILPPQLAAAQDDPIDSCTQGDFDCVGRALNDRLRVILERNPELLAMAPPAFKPDSTVVSIAGPGQTDEDAFPAAGCGTKMRLTVTGQGGAVGYMQCGAVVIQCIVTRGTSCETTGQVEAKAAGKCGIAATPNGPATAVCESQT